MNIELIINELKKLSNKALDNNEVPVAAIILSNNKIIARAYNSVEKDNNVLSHAEIKAIKIASKKLNNWRLNNCELYVTLEPCNMCKQIIKKTRIDKVYYFTKQNNYDTENNTDYCFINNDNYFSNQIKQFFKEKRN